jgi:DNA-binding winged helix-turn-helix (wHTH) protein/Tol biopolymer transport system component
LDLDRGVLLRGSEEIDLRPKSFAVLTYFVEHHGGLLSKDVLTAALWPDLAVTDNSLPQCLVEIRRALGDDSQQMIRTVARRGYIFTPQVTAPVVEFRRYTADRQVEQSLMALSSEPTTGKHRIPRTLLGALTLTVINAALLMVWPTHDVKHELGYTQITDFTDSAVSPALSPDGKMLAFIRSENWFHTRDQIYVKLLPDGEPVQLTHDTRPKYGPEFSPDGSRIVYTVAGWSTFALSPLGGEPVLLLPNSSGLTWLDRGRILFSEVDPPGSAHMGVVTALENRSEKHIVYFPREERGMVHLSYASPDGKWVLVLEMNPVFQPCRVVPMDGTSNGRQVGPKGTCTSAAWSPDGKWMFFGVKVDGENHLWRQRFPDGKPEQITFGPTEEDGIALAPDGRSLITSIGMGHSAVWIHDARGDRALSSEGYVPHYQTMPLFGSVPVFSRDGKSLLYLKSESPGTPTQLWRTDLTTERSEKALPGISIQEFDISDDGKAVVYSSQSSGKPLHLWVAALDRRSPPQLISASGDDSPRFGPDGHIICRSFDGTHHYLTRMNIDGSGRSSVVPYPIGSTVSISPDRRWVVTIGTVSNGSGGAFAVPVLGGAPQRICSDCSLFWAPNGKFIYLFVQQPSRTDAGKTWVLPLKAGELLPKPLSGIQDLNNPTLFPGAHVIDAYAIFPSQDPSVYAYVKNTMHRNLFRIPLR